MELEPNEIEKLYEESFQGFEVGSLLQGKVIKIKDGGVIIDVGYKSEGFIPRGEFSDEEYSALKVGDNVEVYVEDIADSEGSVTLSKEKATKLKAWDVIESCFKDDSPVKGTVTGKTKGGMFVDVMNITAFLPGSHIDIKATRNPDALIGKTMDFKVLKINNRRSNIIVSRRLFLEEDRKLKKAQTIGLLIEGALVEGMVKNITDYGAFIDLGGIDGLLHISDVSWGRITHPSEFFAVGDDVEVIVLKFDPETEKVTLGYKQKRPDPWSDVEEKYPEGSTVKGTVVSITDYGAFIKIEDGLEGLVHISELDWSSRPKHPSKYLSVGETVETVVLRVDKESRRLSLSVKQSMPSPWQLVSERYTQGQTVSGKIKGITEFGVFVGLPEGVDGLVHISDISWTKHIKHPSEVFRKGQKVDTVVLGVEPEKEKIALGIKQLTEDPWLNDISQNINLGDEFKCKVLRKTDFGIFVEIKDDLEGLLYMSEIEDAGESISEGDEVWARIIKIDLENRKIGLSMKNIIGEGE